MLDCHVHKHCLLPLSYLTFEQPQSVLPSCVFLGLQYSQCIGVQVQNTPSCVFSTFLNRKLGLQSLAGTSPTSLPLLAFGPLVRIGSILLPLLATGPPDPLTWRLLTADSAHPLIASALHCHPFLIPHPWRPGCSAVEHSPGCQRGPGVGNAYGKKNTVAGRSHGDPLHSSSWELATGSDSQIPKILTQQILDEGPEHV